jgi:hypothetical protein
MAKFLAAVPMLLLSACLAAPAGTRDAYPSEVAAVEALLEAHGGLECPVLGTIIVAQGPQAWVEAECYRPAGSGTWACVQGVNRHAFDLPGATLMIITEDLGWASHHSTVIHEANHMALWCRDHDSDRRHEDASWHEETRAAERAFLENYPIPDADPFSFSSSMFDGGAP